MVYQEEEQARLKRWHTKQAIALAMQGQWREAVAANKEITASFPNDVDAYNRLGRAYMELGEYSQAKEAYNRAIELDSYNAIAVKNLRRLSHLGKVVGAESDSHKAAPQHFIEEVGKTGVVSLYGLASPEVLDRTAAGDRVYLKVEGANLVVKNSRGEYLGQVEPRYGQRLIKLMEGGNRYLAAIISSSEDKMTVIIREVYQDPSQVGRLSFPPKAVERIRPYVSAGDRLFRRRMEYDEEMLEDSDYTMIGREESDLLTGELPEELPGIDNAADNVEQEV